MIDLYEFHEYPIKISRIYQKLEILGLYKIGFLEVLTFKSETLHFNLKTTTQTGFLLLQHMQMKGIRARILAEATRIFRLSKLLLVA